MKKRILIISSIIISIVIILIIGIVIYEKNIKGNTVELPKDNTLEDNKELYGTWVATNLELYEEGKLKLTIKGQNDKELHISNDNTLSVCQINQYENLGCVDTKYSYTDNKLYVEEDTYLASVSEISFNETEMLVKAINGSNNYSILYFKRK